MLSLTAQLQDNQTTITAAVNCIESITPLRQLTKGG